MCTSFVCAGSEGRKLSWERNEITADTIAQFGRVLDGRFVYIKLCSRLVQCARRPLTVLESIRQLYQIDVETVLC